MARISSIAGEGGSNVVSRLPFQVVQWQRQSATQPRSGRIVQVLALPIGRLRLEFPRDSEPVRELHHCANCAFESGRRRLVCATAHCLPDERSAAAAVAAFVRASGRAGARIPCGRLSFYRAAGQRRLDDAESDARTQPTDRPSSDNSMAN